MEKFLHCQSGGYKEAFAKEQVSLVMVEKEDDWGEIVYSLKDKTVTILAYYTCCIDYECKDSDPR